MDQGDVVRHWKLPQQFKSGLPLDAPKGAFGDFPLGMHHRYSPWFGRMLELSVASFLGDLPPSVRQKRGNDLAAIHDVYKYIRTAMVSTTQKAG
jgi:hypothetical protein